MGVLFYGLLNNWKYISKHGPHLLIYSQYLKKNFWKFCGKCLMFVKIKYYGLFNDYIFGDGDSHIRWGYFG